MAIKEPSLRDRALRFAPFREKLVKVSVPRETGENEELEFLLRQPTVAQRNRILAESQAVKKGGDVDAGGIGRAQAMSVILCALDPLDKSPAFSDGDLESLLNLPAGGWLDELSSQAMGLMSEGEQAAKK